MRYRLPASLLMLIIAIPLSVFPGRTQSANQAPAQPSQDMPPETKAPQATAGHGAAAAKAATLRLTYGSESAVWTPATLADMPHVTVTLYNEHAKANQTYSGVPLTLLLTKLGVPDKPHGKDFRLYVVAEGADGYQVVYSLGEVTPDVHDGTVLVADALGTGKLAETGPFQLVATGEKRPARWVRNLVSVRVLTAQ
jgi:hypothetical protein